MENLEETVKTLEKSNMILYQMLTRIIDAYQDEKPDIIEDVIFDYTTGIIKVYVDE